MNISNSSKKHKSKKVNKIITKIIMNKWMINKNNNK